MKEIKIIRYIIVRIKKEIIIVFEDKFINDNEFTTENEINEVLSLLVDDFDVSLHSKEIEM